MRRPSLWLGGIAAYIALALWVDRFVGLPGQLLIGAVTAAILLAALRRVPAALRAQTVIVVAVATVGEVIGSIIWGLYTYRLENLPAFVPPGHGLVYLGGVALSAVAARHGRLLVGFALVAALVWAAAGVTVLPREDESGALLAGILALFLLRGRAPTVYAGVFVVVAALELYGTVIGTWTWAEHAPGTSLAQGNPPSGIAAGYVFFDVVALALAPSLLALVSRLRVKISSRPAEAAPEAA